MFKILGLESSRPELDERWNLRINQSHEDRPAAVPAKPPCFSNTCADPVCFYVVCAWALGAAKQTHNCFCVEVLMVIVADLSVRHHHQLPFLFICCLPPIIINYIPSAYLYTFICLTSFYHQCLYLPPSSTISLSTSFSCTCLYLLSVIIITTNNLSSFIIHLP